MYTLEDVKRVQKRLLEMAVLVRDILESHKIPYFICAGTLLGAVRHRGFIPWDDDFDIYCFDDTYDKALQVLRKELPSDIFVEDESVEPLYFHAWAHVKDCNSVCHCEQFPQDSCYKHKGISIDIYRYVSMRQSEWPAFKYNSAVAYIEKKLLHGFMNINEFEAKKSVFMDQKDKRKHLITKPEEFVFGAANSNFMFPHSTILPLSNIMFESKRFFAPNKPYDFLKKVYGNYMQLPPIEKRHPHYSSVNYI